MARMKIENLSEKELIQLKADIEVEIRARIERLNGQINNKGATTPMGSLSFSKAMEEGKV
jgi:hypothetical protein